jgi:hypothetical protein
MLIYIIKVKYDQNFNVIDPQLRSLPANHIHLSNRTGMSPVTIVDTGEGDASLPQVDGSKHHVS